VGTTVYAPASENRHLGHTDEAAALEILPADDAPPVRGLIRLPTTVEIHARDLDQPDQPA
jgi:hypothetical protein